MAKIMKRVMSLLLCAALIVSYVPAFEATAASVVRSAVSGTVTDPGTADSWQTMMGTDVDGNRYAGRVWVDKSVYKDGDTVVLNSKADAGSSFKVALEEDEAFQVVFSALGSTMTSKSTITSTGPMDVVLVLDDSTSMDDMISGNTTRLEKLIEASNKLLANLTTTPDIRIGIVAYNQNAMQILPFGTYNNGIELRVRNNKYVFDENNRQDKGGTIQAFDKNGAILYNNTAGYNRGTNTQAGINMGMNMLENAQNTEGRTPVAIVLTDGAANTAAQNTFYNIDSQTPRSIFSGTPASVVLATLLNASYKRVKVADNYGKAPMIYGIGVDIAGDAAANAVINPGAAENGFNNENDSESITDAYGLYTEWLKGKNVERTENYMGNYKFTFDHGYTGVTLEEIRDNIHYVDTYYPVSSAELDDTFQQIYEELSSGVFNPITSSSFVSGGTGVDDTPLIYVDFIGQHMQIKEIQSVTLFGASYGVVKKADGTYAVTEASGTNPTTNERWNTAQDIKIDVIEQADGTQKLEIRINQEILPIILEKVVSETVGDVETATITEFKQDPLRVYYTVGVDSDILLPNGKVDVSKIQGYQYIDDANGTVSFYSNRFGVENVADSSGKVSVGDAHVGFQPSPENRYYYHQANQGIFTKITDKNNNIVTIPENNEYGIVWNDADYDLTWMSYDEYKKAQDTDKVYTYVSYYRPTADQTDAATAAEEITYLVYTDWKYLKESVAFYDNNAEAYLNDGKVIPTGQVESAIAAYTQNNPGAELYAVLGVGSRRTSRLHNMLVGKVSNDTMTAVERYAPEYLENKSQHNDNDVVVWLGNNGKLTVQIDTGIALTKAVTEPIGNVNDTYALTVEVLGNVAAAPVAVDANGNTVASTYSGNILTVHVKAGQTVYISGIPGGTQCKIDEQINGDYYIESQTDTVTVPLVSQVLGGAEQYISAVVTNAPHKYGDLTIIKDIAHDLTETPTAMAQKEFTFRVNISPVPEAGRRTFRVDRTNASAFTADTVTVLDDGSFTVTLKDNESITILDLPADTSYTVTETSVTQGYTNTTGTVSGVIAPDGDHDAHFINTYAVTPIKPQITVTGQKVLLDVHNTYTADENFTFILSQYTGGASDPYTVLATQDVKKGEHYAFALDQLLAAPLGLGNHYFRVTEQSGTTEGMSYDATRGLFVVRVTDADADGVLEYAIEDYANTTVNGNTVTKNFTNTYDVTRTYVDIDITKTLVNATGVELPLDLFHFELVNKADVNDKYTVTTDSAGNATIRIRDLAEGTYAYTLSEVDGAMVGMDYDETVYTVNITVTNNSGVLEAVAQIEGSTQVNGDNTLSVSFRNTYSLTPVAYTIGGSKRLDGRAPVTGEFQFALYQTDSSFVITEDPIDTASNTDNAFDFDKITYTKVGTYYYSIKEIVGNVPGVTYDTTHYHISVHVDISDQDPTKLEVADVVVNKIGANSDTSGGVVFVNAYQAAPTEYAIGGTKVLYGRAPRNGEFAFDLFEGDTWKQTVSNKADGSFAFDQITYTTPGTYTYTIKEHAGSVPGVSYDGVNAPVTVTVTVTDVGGALSASANLQNAQIQFVNTYTAQAAQVTFDGTKTLKGATLADNTFTFNLYATDHSFDTANGSAELLGTAKNVDGAFAFARSIDATGTYYFAIVEDATVDPVADVVYDRTQHNFAVRVTDDGSGQLSAVVTDMHTGVSSGAGASVATAVAFTNATFAEVTQKEVYAAGDVTTQIDGQKVNAGDSLTYFITYTNYTGENVVVDIMDTIPDHTSYVDGSASHNGTYAGTHLNWILNVAKGESVTVSFDVRVNETEAIVANTAVVRDGVNTYYTNEVVNYTLENILDKDVFSPADTTTSIDGKKVYEGDALLYKITFTNVTGDVADVTITDQIPANTTYVAGSADNGGVYDDGVLTWNISDIPAWSTVTVAFQVTVNENIGAVTIDNQAKANDGTNNYETKWVSNYTVADEVVKEIFNANAPTVNIDGVSVKNGDILIYAIRYKNTSLEKVTITIKDTIPAHTTYIADSADNGGVYADGVITWTVDVNAGKAVTVTFWVQVDSVDQGGITNQAVVLEGKNVYTTNTVSTPISNPTDEPTEDPTNKPTDKPTEDPTNKPTDKPTDKPTEDPTDKPADKPADDSVKPSTPQTGDGVNIYLWVALLMVSGGGILAMSFGRRKETEE